MMSAETDEALVADADEVCASCGTTAVDDVKLQDACGLVKYCCGGCRELDRQEHDRLCQKRLAEIRERDLFTQPDESHLGDCPICCLPLSLDQSKSTFMACCCQIICTGCNFANRRREIGAGLKPRCVFCRVPPPKSEEFVKRLIKRVKKNDPVAILYMGNERYSEGNYKGAVEYFIKAAKLGDVAAHYNLSVMYREGEGVEKDMERERHHLEEAAIAGHPQARHNLGIEEAMNGRFGRARKHFIIAANLGYHESLTKLKILYTEGHASKEDYADALRAYQAALDATKSVEREEAEIALRTKK